LIKTKDQVLSELSKFKAQAENFTGQKLLTFRSDNGGEYMSNAFKLFCSSHGFKHEFSQPFTPQSNGLSERENRSLVETAKCLVHHHALPDTLWSKAIKHSAYLLNRQHTKALVNKMPEEAYMNVKQDVS
jgi:transposase InsO family protein